MKVNLFRVWPSERKWLAWVATRLHLNKRKSAKRVWLTGQRQVAQAMCVNWARCWLTRNIIFQNQKQKATDDIRGKEARIRWGLANRTPEDGQFVQIGMFGLENSVCGKCINCFQDSQITSSLNLFPRAAPSPPRHAQAIHRPQSLLPPARLQRTPPRYSLS